MSASPPAVPGPRLSILVVSYNQEQYIARAVEGILVQDLPAGGVEVVVADDGSTDGTREILHRMLDGAPGLEVRHLAADANLGITRNYGRGFAACRGEYVALLEGDDYWTYPGKLRRQIAFLDAHRECEGCGTNYFVHDEESCTFQLKLPQTTGHSFVDARQLVRANLPGNFSNFMYRRKALQALPEGIFALRTYDWLVNICVARSGPLGVLHRPMSVYRVHEKGAWSKLSEADKIRQQLADMRVYDEFTNRVFHKDFDAVAKHLEHYASSIGRHRWRNPAHVTAVFRSLLPPIVLQVVSLLIPPAIPIIYRKVRTRLT